MDYSDSIVLSFMGNFIGPKSVNVFFPISGPSNVKIRLYLIG